MDHKTENQLSYGWMKGFSTVQLELFSKKEYFLNMGEVFALSPDNFATDKVTQVVKADISPILNISNHGSKET